MSIYVFPKGETEARVLRAYPKNRTSGIPMPLIPTHRDASVTFLG